MRYLDNTADSMDMSLGKLWEIVKGRETWCPAVHEVAESDSAYRLNNKYNSKREEALQHLWNEEMKRNQ